MQTTSRVIELSEDNIQAYLSVGNVIIKAWADDCAPCKDYQFIYDQMADANPDYKFASIKVAKDAPSFFRRTYMVAKSKEDKIGTPMTFYFKDGKEVNRYYGILHQDRFKEFVSGAVMDEPKATARPVQVPLDITKATDKDIKARGFEVMSQMQFLQNELQIIQQELMRRSK